MFGYVVADKSALTEKQLKRYRGSYCGLCRSIGSRCGTVCRLSLSYDMSFLLLLLGGLYGFEEKERESVCPMHPFRRQYSFESEATAYAADMNVLLARCSCLDDWVDERRPVRLAEYRLLRRGAARAEERRSRKADAIRRGLKELSEAELRGEPGPDPGANAFAALMGELFVMRDDEFAPVLYELGSDLGRYVYLADALKDYEADRKKGRYNPLAGLYAEGAEPEEVLTILSTLADSCLRWLDTLPLRKDGDILRHILQSGIWSVLEEGRKTNDDP